MKDQYLTLYFRYAEYWDIYHFEIFCSLKFFQFTPSEHSVTTESGLVKTSRWQQENFLFQEIKTTFYWTQLSIKKLLKITTNKTDIVTKNIYFYETLFPSNQDFTIFNWL